TEFPKNSTTSLKLGLSSSLGASNFEEKVKNELCVQNSASRFANSHFLELFFDLPDSRLLIAAFRTILLTLIQSILYKSRSDMCTSRGTTYYSFYWRRSIEW